MQPDGIIAQVEELIRKKCAEVNATAPSPKARFIILPLVVVFRPQPAEARRESGEVPQPKTALVVHQDGPGLEKDPDPSNSAGSPGPAACWPGVGGAATGRLKAALESFWHVGDLLREQATHHFKFNEIVWELQARGIEVSANTLQKRFNDVQGHFREQWGNGGLCLFHARKRKGSIITGDGWRAWERIGQARGKTPAGSR
jgi:hypothetical protein